MTVGLYRHFARVFDPMPEEPQTLDELLEGYRPGLCPGPSTCELVLPAAASLRDALDRGAVSEDQLRAYLPANYERDPGWFHEDGVASAPSISEDLRQMASIVDEGATSIEGQFEYFQAHLAGWLSPSCEAFSAGTGPPEVEAYYQAE